jgi:IS5 family transposase
MLRTHCLQLWWNMSDPAMEEELHERPLYRRFAGLAGASKLPDDTTILRFRHLLEKHSLAPQVRHLSGVLTIREAHEAVG